MKQMQKLRQKLDLPVETALHSPITVEEHQVVIHMHQGIDTYEPDLIRVLTKRGFVAVSGVGLEVSKMSPARIVVSGQIQRVELERKV